MSVINQKLVGITSTVHPHLNLKKPGEVTVFKLGMLKNEFEKLKPQIREFTVQTFLMDGSFALFCENETL